MLSILIPIYNNKVVKLVDELIYQCKRCKIDYEIICLDDMSKQKYRTDNGVVNGLMGVNYVELSENIGRARIRNRLAKLARYERLIFLDSDTKLAGKKFIKNYIDQFDESEIIVGGTKYDKKPPKNQKKLLHWTYGSKREAVSAKKRNRNPSRHFHTNNFSTTRTIALAHPFDESIKGYGYEDLALGEQLSRSSHAILHIDNPTIHRGLKEADDFLKDQKTASENLATLYYEGSIQNTKLIKTYQRVKKIGMRDLIMSSLSSRIEKMELGVKSHPKKLYKLDLIKLYYFDSALNNIHIEANE